MTEPKTEAEYMTIREPAESSPFLDYECPVCRRCDVIGLSRDFADAPTNGFWRTKIPIDGTWILHFDGRRCLQK